MTNAKLARDAMASITKKKKTPPAPSDPVVPWQCFALTCTRTKTDSSDAGRVMKCCGTYTCRPTHWSPPLQPPCCTMVPSTSYPTRPPGPLPLNASCQVASSSSGFSVSLSQYTRRIHRVWNWLDDRVEPAPNPRVREGDVICF